MGKPLSRRSWLRAGGLALVGSLAGCGLLSGSGTPLSVVDTTATTVDRGIPRLDVTIENVGDDRATGKLTGRVTLATDNTITRHRVVGIDGGRTRTVALYVVPEFGVLPPRARPITAEASISGTDQPSGPIVEDPSPLSPVAGGGWPSSEYDGGNTKFNPAAKAPTEAPAVDWTRDRIAASRDVGPVVHDGSVYAGNPVTELEAETGEVLHQFGDHRRYSALVVLDGVLAFWGEDAALGFDLASRERRWRRSRAWAGREGITRAGGLFVLLEGSSTGSREGARVRGIRPKSGEVAWTATLPDLATLPASDGEVVYTAADDRLWALAAEDGSTTWKTSLPEPASYPASVAYDTVFQPTSEGRLEAFSTDDGTRRWTTWLVDTPRTAPAIAKQTVVAGMAPWDGGGVVTAVDAVTGSIQWSTTLGGTLTTSVSVVDDVVLAGTDAGELIGLALESGSERFRRTITEEKPYGDVAVASDRMFVNNSLGPLVALG